MTLSRMHRSLQDSASLRIVLAAVILFSNLFGHAHILHAPAPEVDSCGAACPLHLSTHSVLDDHDLCGICSNSTNFGIDGNLHTAVVTREIQSRPAPIHSSILPAAPAPGPASPRGPPLA